MGYDPKAGVDMLQNNYSIVARDRTRFFGSSTRNLVRVLTAPSDFTEFLGTFENSKGNS